MRDKAGALRQGALRADDRADALRQIRAMGGTPVSVTEGQPRAAPKFPRRPAAFAAAGVLALAAALSLLLRHRGAESQGRRDSGNKPLPAAAAPAPSPARQPPPVKDKARLPDAGKPEAAAQRPGAAAQGTAARPETVPGAPGAVPPAAPPAPDAPVPPRPRPYTSATEGLLSMAMSVPPGAMVPPLPISRDLDGDFANSLTNTIVIYDDDDERTTQIKENVAAAKNQLLELVKQGRSVADVLKEYQETVNEKTEIRSKAQTELDALYRDGKTRAAQEYLEGINAAFKDLDIEPISLPQARKKR
jgi:hypothetical protein